MTKEIKVAGNKNGFRAVILFEIIDDIYFELDNTENILLTKNRKGFKLISN